MPLKYLHLIRHGETDWNANHRWQGHIDVPLSTRGLEQARLLAEYLRPRPITAVYASDLQRARVTAEPIAHDRGLKPITDPRWREIHLGVLQGLTRNEIEVKYPHELEGMGRDWFDHVIEGGESRRMMMTRGLAALDQVRQDAPGPEAVVVSHGGTIRVLLRALFPNTGTQHIPIENTSITTLSHHDGQWSLLSIAETPHLKPHKVDPQQEAQ